MEEKQAFRNPLPCRSWTATNQILVFTIFFTILILGLTICISQLLLDLSSSYLREISEQISHIQTKKEVYISSFYQLRYTKQYFRSDIKKFSSINDLYSQVLLHNMTLEPPTDCLTPVGNPIAQIYQFCYARFANEYTNQSLELPIFQLTSLINVYAPMFDLSAITYFSSKEPNQFTAAYNLTMPSIYRPHIRSWYKDHLDTILALNGTNQIYKLSDPYVAYNSTLILVSETMSLTNLDGEFDGVIGQNSEFPHIPEASYGQPLIVNEQGMLLTKKVNGKEAKMVNSIFMTNFTGFTEEDWLLLKTISSPNVLKITILFNQIKNTNVQISATKLNNYYLFLYIDDTYFRNISNQIIHQIDEFYSTQYLQILLTGLVSLTINIILQILSIKFVFLKDLIKLSLIAKNQILKHSILFTQLKVQDLISDIKELFISYYKALNNLVNNQKSQKNKQCKEIENINYPIQPKLESLKKQFSQIQLQILEQLGMHKLNITEKQALQTEKQALQLYLNSCHMYFCESRKKVSIISSDLLKIMRYKNVQK